MSINKKDKDESQDLPHFFKIPAEAFRFLCHPESPGLGEVTG
jgi:hypothetical protein